MRLIKPQGTRISNEKAKEKLYKDVLAAINPLAKKFGADALRWALNRWAKNESRRLGLLKRKKELEKELSSLT